MQSHNSRFALMAEPWAARFAERTKGRTTSRAVGDRRGYRERERPGREHGGPDESRTGPPPVERRNGEEAHGDYQRQRVPDGDDFLKEQMEHRIWHVAG